ncbi:hypothetical protein [Cronobacter sakazakii]|uniref:hypothetical protein n=1 Tax=Cronobacter sakazakii TaxID=28141 RepID=UPI00131A2595|nr:hypothetical protein [Cronobacter sakazakii]
MRNSYCLTLVALNHHKSTTGLSFHLTVLRQHPALTIGFNAHYLTSNIISGKAVFNFFPVQINGDALSPWDDTFTRIIIEYSYAHG